MIINKIRLSRWQKRIVSWCGNLIFYIGLISFFALIYNIGFIQSAYNQAILNRFFYIALGVLFYLNTIEFILSYSQKNKNRIVTIASSILFFILLFVYVVNYFLLEGFFIKAPYLSIFKSNIVVWAIVLIAFFVEVVKKLMKFDQLNIPPAKLFIFSFLFVILFGTGMLLLPNSTTNGIPFLDALFTATSAVCITGLIVVDTASCFTPMGQNIILLLIQIGGLGIMTFTCFFGFFFAGSSSYRDQLFLKDFFSTEKMGEVFKFVFRIVVVTFIVEGVGAIAIFYTLPSLLFSSVNHQIQFSIFHSISAFCNAGFSTLSDGFYNINVRYNYTLHTICAFIIIIGGIGFPIVFNYLSALKHFVKNIFKIIFFQKKFEYKPRIINVNSKIVVRTTFLLLFLGMLFLLMFDNNNAFYESKGWGAFATALFSSATSRTAGFNTIDFSTLSHGSILLVMFLMWVGASPGSTGGGIKTTTFAVACLNAISIARGKDRIEVFKREISNMSIRRSYAIIFLSILIIGIGFSLLSYAEPNKEIIPLLFETVSAFSTVGLSLGITPDLSGFGKGIIILLMFIGRIGTLTILVAFIRKVKTLHYRYPSESIFTN